MALFIFLENTCPSMSPTESLKALRALFPPASTPFQQAAAFEVAGIERIFTVNMIMNVQ